MTTKKDKLRALISQAKTDKAIQLLLDYSNEKDWKNEVIQQSAGYKKYKQDVNKGLLSSEENRLILARINNALLEIGSIYLTENKKSKTTATLEHKNKAIPTWKYIVGFGVIISILGGMAEFSGYNLKDLWTTDDVAVDYFDVTVFVHAKEGRHQPILEDRGKVVMDLNTDKRDEKIGDKGEVNFKQLPANFKNQKVTFYLTDTEKEPYQVVQPDSQYVLMPNKAIHLAVFLANLDKIKGTVRDRTDTSKRLAGVKVCIEDICVETDEDGRFLLRLPENRQRKFQTISFRKDGYAEYVKHNVPMQLEDDFDVILESIPSH